jgi:hypothetical protein
VIKRELKLFYYYESTKRTLQTKYICGCRCYERLQPNTKEFTRLSYTLKIEEALKPVLKRSATPGPRPTDTRPLFLTEDRNGMCTRRGKRKEKKNFLDARGRQSEGGYQDIEGGGGQRKRWTGSSMGRLSCMPVRSTALYAPIHFDFQGTFSLA